MRQEKKAPPRIPGRKKGLLVVLEGIDGTGKSTQARALLRRLRAAGIPAARFREPSRGRWGREIKRLARTAGSVTPERELELFVKDRRENVERNLEPALRAGKVVVLDRYYFSTVAYQGAKGLDPVRIRRLNERFAPRPDLVFILDLDPEAGLARIAGRGRRDELFEKEDYLARVREIFLGFKGKRFVHLDAGRGKRALGRDLWERVRRLAMPRPI
jgi:dTMP kinase